MDSIIERVLQTNLYIQPIHFFLAITTNTLNILILSCRTFRSSLCTYYFLTYAILSIIYTCLLCPIQFSRAFSIDLIRGQNTCKIHVFLLFVIPFQANLMLLLASFDRYYSSYQLSHIFSIRTIIFRARRNILLGITFSILYMFPMIFIYYWDDNFNKCRLKSHRFIQIYISSQILLYYFLSPLLMLIFGTLTIIHIHHQSKRCLPLLLIYNQRRRRTERQLARMLFLQITIHLILVLPFGIIYALHSWIPSSQTSTSIAIRLAFLATM